MRKTNHADLLLLVILSSAISFSSTAQPSKPVQQQSTDTVLVVRSTPAQDSAKDGYIVFVKTEVEASVDRTEWRKHLQLRLVPIIQNAAAAGIKAGKYTIKVRFIVEKDGSISEVTALNDFGYGLAPGAINVVKTGPRWTPAMQNGRKVRAYQTQPITFVISEK